MALKASIETLDRLADQQSAESHREGWTEAVDKLDRLFEP